MPDEQAVTGAAAASLSSGLTLAAFDLPPSLPVLLEAVKAAGGRALLVGGCVRDALRGLPSQDIDLEVYGLEPLLLQETLARHAKVYAVGVSFGVLKVALPEGFDLDVTIPRRESRPETGQGRRGFLGAVDATMTPGEAAARRDFTVNALAFDPASGAVLDFFNGQADLAAGVLRHVGPAFAEDPLRVLRAMQFAARWDFRLAPETVEMCASLRSHYAGLPKERIWGEWYKLLVKGQKPSSGLRVLEQTGWRQVYLALEGLSSSRQALGRWAWEHTLEAVDAAARLAQRDQLADVERATLLLATLCHAMPTGEEAAGTGALQFLLSINCPQHFASHVLPLVHEGSASLEAVSDVSMESRVRRLAQRLVPATLRQWERLLEAIGVDGSLWLQRAVELGCADGPVVPLLQGRHLKEAQLKPGPHFRPLLEAAFEAQLDGAFDTLAGARVWLARQLLLPD